MKILVIEDDVPVAELLAHAIQSEGHEAMVAVTPRVGLELLDREHPDGVLLDMVLPEVSGLDVLRHIRSRSPHLPVVIITGLATPEQTAEARRLGVTDVIEKPLLLKQLSTALGSLRSARDSGQSPPESRRHQPGR
jgi:two-component system cell cycle response regulator